MVDPSTPNLKTADKILYALCENAKSLNQLLDIAHEVKWLFYIVVFIELCQWIWG